MNCADANSHPVNTCVIDELCPVRTEVSGLIAPDLGE